MFRPTTTVIRGYRAYIRYEYKTYICCPNCNKGMLSEMEICPHCDADVPTKEFSWLEIIDTTIQILIFVIIFSLYF
ncbi:hypothetical protein FACS189472_07450 [Alphaproteobacteria bacterium]|nr:hypothetical protein FACS1894126_0050 [Alphaproteobacteria bacterium]GHU18712.1 hypothetical protein FACS189472_07450 [Alphaproteobacteria bacterium]